VEEGLPGRLREAAYPFQVVAVLGDQARDDPVRQPLVEAEVRPRGGQGFRGVVAQVVGGARGRGRLSQASTFAIRSSAQSASSRVITRGGAKRMTWWCVSFARMPSSISFSQ